MDEGSPQPLVEAPATVRDTTVDINMRSGNRLKRMGTFQAWYAPTPYWGAFSKGSRRHAAWRTAAGRFEAGP